MRKMILVALSLFASFGLGWMAANLASGSKHLRQADAWFPLAPPPGEKGASYTTEAIFGSDIALPDIEAIGGSAKYINDGTPTSADTNLGYKILVKVRALDLAKVPSKYKKERVLRRGTDPVLTTPPVEQVVYEVKFQFTLLDRDGFSLLRLESEKESVTSGKDNAFQAVVPRAVPLSVASRTSTIGVTMHVLECLTCEAE